MSKAIRILLVDDDPVNNFVTTKALKAYLQQVEVALAEDGQKALDYLETLLNEQAELPNILLLDINMPVMDGWELLDELQLKGNPLLNNICIYMYTSSQYMEDNKRAMSYSIVKGIVSKPFSKEQLLEIVDTCTPTAKE